MAQKRLFPGGTSAQYLLCKQFVLSKLLGDQGEVYSNYEDVPSDNLTKGHDVLAESQGLLMLSALKTKDRALFDRAWGYANDKMQSDSGLFSWRIVENEKANSSATVDDLRIVDALLRASQTWETKEYDRDIAQLSKALLAKCIQNNLPVSSFDFSSETMSTMVQLSYLDLYTIRSLEDENRGWKKVFSRSKQLLLDAAIQPDAPLYYSAWDIDQARFIPIDKINMIDSLLVEYHLVQAGNINTRHISWLKTQLEKGKIYSEYNASGTAVSAGESTAVYAIVMLIADEVDDQDLYALARDRMTEFQVDNQDSEIYGAFGDEKNLQVYSFDNLLALLAL